MSREFVIVLSINVLPRVGQFSFENFEEEPDDFVWYNNKAIVGEIRLGKIDLVLNIILSLIILVNPGLLSKHFTDSTKIW